MKNLILWIEEFPIKNKIMTSVETEIGLGEKKYQIIAITIGRKEIPKVAKMGVDKFLRQELKKHKKPRLPQTLEKEVLEDKKTLPNLISN